MADGMTAAELVVRYTADTSNLAAGAARAQGSLKGFASGASRAGSMLTRGVTLPLVGAAVASVKTAMDFEKTMNTMGAVAGVPGPQLKTLGDLALKMGQDTVFSANEAGTAMLELAKAGIKPAEIEAGALANTLDLATAGDLELADAATVASNAMNTFGLSGKESQKAVDALAGAANTSSASVSDIALALSMGGNAAATMGLSIEETTGALAAFADQGIRGSDAGTSLKTMLLNLAPTTAKAKDMQKELGLEFFNSAGEAKGLTGIASELEQGLGGLSQKQRVTALKTMFGTDAFRAANIVMKQGASGMRKYIKGTSDVGAAQDVAKAKMKGFAGSWEQLMGSLETAGLKIGRILIPPLTKGVKKVTELLNAFTDLPSGTQKAIVGIAGVAAVAGPLLWTAGKLAGSWSAVSTALGRTKCAPAVACLGQTSGGLGGITKKGPGAASALGKVAGAAGLMAIAFEGMRELDSLTDNMMKGSKWARALGGGIRDAANSMTAGGFSAFNWIVDKITGTEREAAGAAKGLASATDKLVAKLNLGTTAEGAFRKVMSTATDVTSAQRGKIGGLMEGFVQLGGKLSGATVKTVQNMLAVGDESAAMRILREAINALPAHKNTKITADTSEAMSRLSVVKSVLDAIPRTVTTRYTIAKNAAQLRAAGGPVKPRELYMVGEQGPEMFVPHTAGKILSNKESGNALRPSPRLTGSRSGRRARGIAEGQARRAPASSGPASLAGVEIVGVLETAWGPAEIRALVTDEIAEEGAFRTARARQRRAG